MRSIHTKSRPERAYIVTVTGMPNEAPDEKILVFAKDKNLANKKAAMRLRKRGIYLPLGSRPGQYHYHPVLRTPTPISGGRKGSWLTMLAFKDIDAR